MPLETLPTAQQHFTSRHSLICSRTDRLFAYLLILQWVLGIATAIWISPYSWEGTEYSIHSHVWASIILGGIIVSLPVYLTLTSPGHTFTRHSVAVGQMATSALLIHLTGGRIESHFHVFGSLAFLAFYRDIPVLITATVVVALDHGLRGYLWPESVYGVMNPGMLRFVEHTGWVVFENIFLFVGISQTRAEMKRSSEQRVQLQESQSQIESEVAKQTAHLTEAIQEIEEVNAKYAQLNMQLSQKNEELDRFTYVASHDIRTPLRGIANLASWVQEDCSPILPEDSKAHLQKIGSRIDHLDELLEELLAYSRVGKNDCEMEDVSLSDMWHSLTELVRNPDGLEFRHNFNGLKEVKTYAVLLRQVILNLLSNAVKYNDKGNSGWVELTAKDQGNFLELTMTDNGIGIKDEDLEVIFQMYHRVQSVRAEGTGMGLPIAKKQVEFFGGTIDVTSEVGVKTTFRFTWPKEVEATAEDAQLVHN